MLFIRSVCKKWKWTLARVHVATCRKSYFLCIHTLHVTCTLPMSWKFWDWITKSQLKANLVQFRQKFTKIWSFCPNTSPFKLKLAHTQPTRYSQQTSDFRFWKIKSGHLYACKWPPQIFSHQSHFFSWTSALKNFELIWTNNSHSYSTKFWLKLTETGKS